MKKIKTKAPRACKGCGKAEKITDFGGMRYSNIANYLGYCADCINRTMDLLNEQDAQRTS